MKDAKEILEKLYVDMDIFSRDEIFNLSGAELQNKALDYALKCIDIVEKLPAKKRILGNTTLYDRGKIYGYNEALDKIEQSINE